MEAMEAILTRASVRKFTGQSVSDEDLQAVLQAGMSGPCCKNLRDWSFLVVRSKETLAQMAQVNGQFSAPLLGADVGILICGDMTRILPMKEAKDFWVIDASIAIQNMSLCAHALGLGSVWLGTYPLMDRVNGLAQLFHLPASTVPHSILALGHPDPTGRTLPRPAFEADRIHYETW